MRSEPISIHMKHQKNPKGLIRIALPELCGDDELALEGINTAAGLTLLARLCKRLNIHTDLDVHTLSASQRDMMWAAMHRQYWGDKILSSIRCNACGTDFDLSFQLSTLQKILWSNVQHSSPILPPNGLDEVQSMESHHHVEKQVNTLAELCLQKNLNIDASEISAETLSKLLSEQAPIIDVDLKAVCTECQHENTVRFDVQTYVLQKILNDHDVLWMQVDTLARKYQWSLNEILSLSRSVRHHLSQ